MTEKEGWGKSKERKTDKREDKEMRNKQKLR